MTPPRSLLAMLAGLAACRAPLPPPAAAPAPSTVAAHAAAGYEAEIAPLLARYCVGCHSGERKKGGLALDGFGDERSALARPGLWRDVAERIASHDMPPEGEPQPSDAERAAVVRWNATTVRAVACRRPDPGLVTLRRLNRREYENTVRDLFGIDVGLADELPLDTSGEGFDNLAGALTTSPLYVERALAAADRALAAVFADPTQARSERRRRPAAEVEVAQNARPLGDGRVVLASLPTDDLGVTVDEPFEAEWRIAARLGNWVDPPRAPVPGQPPPAPPDPPRAPRVEVRIDGATALELAVDASVKVRRTYEARVRVPAGRHRLRFVVPNDQREPPAPPPPPGEKPKFRPGAKVLAEWFEVEGPMPTTRARSAAYQRLFAAGIPPRGREREAARELLGDVAGRAFRRPVTTAELDALVSLAARVFARGEPFEAGIRVALRAVLVSPSFLFRSDFDPRRGRPNGVTPLDDFALAARLSYFLWSTMPDAELTAEASRGTLRANLDHQLGRLFTSPRAEAFVRDFGGQWLEIRAIDEASPAFFIYRNWDEPLRAAMRAETELVLGAFLREDRPIVELLDADWTFANERLAKHYGLADVNGAEFRKVSLAATPRRGILTHGSILTITSNAMRTSPVKRGKWVLEALLDDPPPPPPPDAPSLPEAERGRKLVGTVRQQLEQHRANPTCAGCHARMDPLGFGLEQFDAVGAVRSKDNGADIDASGTLTTGETFSGAAELAALLVRTRRDAFERALAKRLLTYAIGRALGYDDDCAVDGVVATARARGGSLAAFIRAVAHSAPFLYTRGDEAPDALTATTEVQSSP